MRCQQLKFGKRAFRFKIRLFSLDASLIPLCVSLFDWAEYRRTKGAVNPKPDSIRVNCRASGYFGQQ